ncbi:MAG: acyl-CoA thioesterase [Planctomycetes bacterium]|nr:acyl-CoA thioesterase [Planctomycetota bacterium]
MYKYETVIRLHHTDAAGLVFYAKVFVLAHECYESFLEEHQMSLASMIDEGDYIAPIVHAKADLKAAMRMSDRITIEMQLARTGKSSYELAYKFTNQQGKITTEITTIHAVIDKSTSRPIRIPEKFEKVLRKM